MNGMQLGDKKLIVQRASAGNKHMVGAPAQLQVTDVLYTGVYILTKQKK